MPFQQSHTLKKKAGIRGCEQLKNQSSPRHSHKHITDLKFPLRSSIAPEEIGQ